MAVPKIRFKGFSGEWEQRKLGEVVEKLKSYSLSRDVECETVTGYRYIHYGDIHKQRADIIINDEQLPNINIGNYIPLQCGDVVIADASEDYMGIAEPSVVMHEPTDKIIAGLHTIAMRPINCNSLYLYYLLHTEHFKKFGGETGTGLKVFGITFNNLAKYETSYPTIYEQTTIGNLFRTLDDIIALYKRKLDGLKELKKGYMQYMFPQAGESVPRVRFAGFSGEWEEKKLGEVANIVAGGDVDKSKLLDNGNYPVYANALTNEGLVGYYKNDYRIEAPAVTVTGRGDVGFAKARIINFTPVVRLLSVQSVNDVYFLENAINNHNVFIESTGVPQLTVPQLSKYNIFIPTLPEQTAVGNFFHTLDEQITAQQSKLDKLKQLKAAYLQKMFV